LLRSIRQALQTGTLQTGLLHDRPVIHLNGELDPAKVPAFKSMKLTALSASAYFDAKTLWPVRIEWWGADKAGCRRPLAQIEFRDPIVGVPLSDDECARMFSYAPDGSEQVSEFRRRR
jgi:hypothetical protein